MTLSTRLFNQGHSFKELLLPYLLFPNIISDQKFSIYYLPASKYLFLMIKFKIQILAIGKKAQKEMCTVSV